MKRFCAALGITLSTTLNVPSLAKLSPEMFTTGQSLSPTTDIARAGGGGGRVGGGGGLRMGGGGGPAKGLSGFQSAGGGLNRGAAKPTGGWSGAVSPGAGTGAIRRPSTQPNGNRDLGTRDFGSRNQGNRELGSNDSRGANRDVTRNVSREVNRNWTRTVNLAGTNLHPGWARPGWGVARPWRTGWYGGWSTPTWGWWGARAAAWGIVTLATATIINDAVDTAVAENNSMIVIPNTTYQLLYGTIQPSGTSNVTFVVNANGTNYELTADCQRGLINGQIPQNADEAQVLNAACQVAYGSAS